MTIDGMENRLNLIHDAVLPLKKDVSHLYEIIIVYSLEVMQRIHQFTVVSNDEAKKLSDDISKLNTNVETPTKSNHERCHECNCSKSELGGKMKTDLEVLKKIHQD